MEPQQVTPWNDTQKILAMVVTLSFIAVIFLWLFHPPADSNSGTTAVLNTLVGAFSGFEAMIITYYFGSSRTASTNANTIAALVAPDPTHPPLPKTTPSG